MTTTRESALRIALILVGAVCLALGPLMLLMTFQALADAAHRGHLVADVPALFLAAIVFSLLLPRHPRTAASLPGRS